MRLNDFEKFKGESIRIAIIDSGVDVYHETLKNAKIRGVGIKLSDDSQSAEFCEDFSDSSGHGTAVVQLISKTVPCAEFFMIKLFDDSLESTEEALLFTLKYVLENLDADILNLSLGITACDHDTELREICKLLEQKGVIIVSAFDNDHAISYPAAYPSVIGVDTGENCWKCDDFEYVNGGIVNIRAKGGLQRAAWGTPAYRIVAGNSFAAAHVTAFTAKIMQAGNREMKGIIDVFRDIAIFTYPTSVNMSDDNRMEKVPFKMGNAAIFPFTKEMHALVRFPELLSFDIAAIYDIKYSGRVGAAISKLLNLSMENDWIVQNIENINWDDIDTLVLGHCDKLSSAFSEISLAKKLAAEALDKGKNVYSFDPIDGNYTDKRYNHRIFFPKILKESIPINRFGKMRSISKPVLGVCGTSSKQGKYTLQLILRKALMTRGYCLSQLGSEPTALLFGMDKVYHVGYNSDLSISRWDNYHLVNELVYEMSLEDVDIVLFGCQASTIPHNFNNTMFFNPFCMEMLLGAQPDAVILCINYYDSVEYIRRTIYAIEAMTDCKVIGLVMYPMRLKDDWSGYVGSKIKVSPEEFMQKKHELDIELDKDIFYLGEETEMEKLVDLVVSFFT